jgi:hypothetical protein
MKPVIILAGIFLCGYTGLAQSNFPWDRPLKIARSTDGANFTNVAIYQDSSGVPSLIHWKGDTLVCVFQWFRKPVNSITWDRVSVKFSYNAGATWTSPVPIIVNGLPAGYQRPFDPTIAVVNNTSLRIFYSSSASMPIGGLDTSINTYSAISTDGINFTFEAGPRFDHPTNRVIDPAVIRFSGTWHYVAPIGAPQEGAYHATSSDGLSFSQQVNLSSDQNHNWTGNFMLNGPSELRFYGSGSNVWYSASSDGNAWQGFVNTNIKGGDPSVLRISPTNYIAVYVGETYITGLDAPGRNLGLVASPNPASDKLVLRVDEHTMFGYHIYSSAGALKLSGTATNDDMILVSDLTPGLYVVLANQNSKLGIAKFVKQN